MKIKLLLFALIILAFASCKKDDDNNSITGTAWEYNDDGWRLLTFNSNNSVTFEYSGIIIGGNNKGTIKGTYVYDSPTITIILSGEQTIGTISGNTLNIGELIFTKQ